MKDMVAFFGLNCHEYGAFLATKENDDRKRSKVAQEWSKLFKVDIRPEDINCEGCQSDGGRLFNYCKVCEIRKCGKEKSLKNCGYCGDYPCHKLDFIFSNSPQFWDQVLQYSISKNGLKCVNARPDPIHYSETLSYSTQY